MRRTLDHLLAAPGLTRGRFVALALLSLLATATVVAAGVRHDQTPWDLVAAARSRPAPVVEVTPRRPAPAPVASAPVAAEPAPAPVANAAPVVSEPVSTPALSTTPTETPASDPAPTDDGTETVATPAKPASKVKHVFVVDAPAAAADPAATYLAGLRAQGRVLDGYAPLTQGALATRIALVSGQQPTPGIEQGCPSYGGDCLFPIETLTLADQLVSSGKRWRGYFGAMPAACTHPAPGSADAPVGDYATQSNPFVYFRSLTDLGECGTNDLPLDSLNADLATLDATPNLAWITPAATCADAACADQFLTEWIPKILDSAAYKADGLLIVLGDGPGGALLVSQFAQAASSSQVAYDPYGIARGIEDLFGLQYLGGDGSSFAATELSAGLN